MRVIKDNTTALPSKTEPGLPPEQECTCTKCLSKFAFRQTDPEVVTTNELEFLVNCPVCETSLEIGKHTGIVRLSNPEN